MQKRMLSLIEGQRHVIWATRLPFSATPRLRVRKKVSQKIATG